ncbi:hypothetical protein V6C03_08400 [Methyloligella sp. 2.7D]|uniref:hypothetical protein n=1 Tax=unclassified Methyloligella TaxID=2625955 RepID=UPI00157C0DED|nr:hypothetical protein [Methyloligella sp. GL2]QKP78109.1 hypothetical protein HT051_12050 [Methyloligella sp. GL2]
MNPYMFPGNGGAMPNGPRGGPQGPQAPQGHAQMHYGPMPGSMPGPMPGPAGYYAYTPGPGWAPAGNGQAPAQGVTGLINNRFVTGLLVGGALTYVLTNEAVQHAAIRGITQLWLGIQGGLEETKERFRDAESEIKAEHEE